MSENYGYGLISIGRRERGLPPCKKEKSGHSGSMRCPSCKSKQTVLLDTRPKSNHEARRRACASCGTRFGTREYIENIALRIDVPFPPEKFNEVCFEWRQNVKKVIEGIMS